MTLAELARRIDLPRATARRALLTLRHLGFVAAEGRQFRLTPRVLRLAAAYLDSSAATALLQPACESLSAELGETCSVAVLEGEEAVMIAYASPRRLYVEGAGPGLRLPAHCSAVGRVLLAALPDAERDACLRRLRPRPATPHTLTDKAALRRLLDTVRAEGHALVDQEAEMGFRSLAVPLARRDGRVVAALNTGLRVERASAEALRERCLPPLRDAAARLREHLL
ncbi:helix-turn-helix domain-containing protein [Roseomonas sp. NAR14]|uniref:Helix-turn-helix domain-containing protein n=2 Tax=Roseomonas acroporae TaxID=2937791 RepID=A0A9X2BVW1_9PROT|nr:helix-turn-helix domain-containing protein [Roseomonas acroporae]